MKLVKMKLFHLIQHSNGFLSIQLSFEMNLDVSQIKLSSMNVRMNSYISIIENKKQIFVLD